ncbi:hypothetical protein HOK51_06400 [Candidatus Woesearchaeota archaeon]|jgi:hypothetical protein|nr:hypothetical protein [Candidatus Woesearchaeota archaeon]MBT6519454.1 hypothetical protein [Candidatus Woesearchaeota archaeon]MBT7368884.1 hypothetical protein [Candidatus Woesearchaeota archaeon]
MTYVIEGKLKVSEKPEKYLNTYVDFKRIENVRGGSTTTKTTHLITSSERIANWLNKRGNNLELNQDLERAVEMCQQREISICKSKIFKPKKTWEEYLTKTFKEQNNLETLSGELTVWTEFRFPSPWLYVFSHGELNEKYIFNGTLFTPEQYTKHEGTRHTTGIILDTPILKLRKSKTTTKTKTKTYTPFSESVRRR